MMPSFKKLMTHILTIRKRERDWQGSFSNVAVYPGVRGFVEYGKRIVTNLQGEEVISSATIFLPNHAPINIPHENWMIDQTAPYPRKNMEVIRIDPIDDPRTGKTHHYEVTVR